MTLSSELDLTIESKRYASPRARAGLRSHHPMLNSFALLSPNWPVLSQQSPKVPFEPRKSWGLFWLANPLDLTPEFLRANREFWGKIALIGSNAPIPRIVYASMMATRYYAARSAEANKVDREITTQVKATRTQRESLGRWRLLRTDPSSKAPSASSRGRETQVYCHRHGKFAEVLPRSRGPLRSLPRIHRNNGRGPGGRTLHFRGSRGRCRPG
jgi:3'-phosphoadenosine 5'-phosphosulfate (PAPS) 3'-phosphatase